MRVSGDTMQEPERKQQTEGAGVEPSFWQVVHSVLAAFFGVQSARNRERDFTAGRPSAYIFVGAVMALVLVLLIFGLVRLIMHLAGV